MNPAHVLTITTSFILFLLLGYFAGKQSESTKNTNIGWEVTGFVTLALTGVIWLVSFMTLICNNF